MGLNLGALGWYWLIRFTLGIGLILVVVSLVAFAGDGGAERDRIDDTEEALAVAAFALSGALWEFSAAAIAGRLVYGSFLDGVPHPPANAAPQPRFR